MEQSPAEEDGEASGAAGPARVGGGALARESFRARLAPPAARTPVSRRPKLLPSAPRLPVAAEHVVRCGASAAPASRERAFQALGARREQQRQQRRPRGLRTRAPAPRTPRWRKYLIMDHLESKKKSKNQILHMKKKCKLTEQIDLSIY